MKRRDFIATGCAASLATLSMHGLAHAEEESSKSPTFIDFRMITVPDPERKEALVKYNGEILTPIIKKHGISPVGLFVSDSERNAKEKVFDKKYDSIMFGLVPHKNLDSTLALAGKIQSDVGYRESYAALSKGTTSKDPLFTAHERMLLRCFTEFPEVKVPTLSPNRILQLRMYRSHSFERNRAKIDMFTKGSEIALFEECGIKPVFFSEMFFGSFIPSIVFMLSFENEEQMKASWSKFVNHPDWKKLSTDPTYADTATEIVNVYLKPCKGSEI